MRSEESGISKIRNLMRDMHDDKLCIQHIIDHLISLSKSASKLEVSNNKKALEDLKRGIRKARDMSHELYNRLLNEVQPEVIEYHEYKPKGKPRGKNIQENIKDNKD